ncbi:MAG: hypothetical protein JO148_16625, partial [Acidimicrobiia bacterium]|nr:hypothetical protein [Acidimicrobiia bacterium]
MQRQETNKETRSALPRWLAFGVLVAALTSGGIAYASFTATGSSTGQAHSGDMQTVTVSAFVGGDAPTSKLYPSGPATDVILR